MERKRYNKAGKLSSAPGGYGQISPKGYRRIWDKEQKRYRMEHVLVWEKHFGKIPKGKWSHHKDRNKLNNDISNLEILDITTHKRIHSGCKIIKRKWWKPCCKCGQFQPIDNYYKRISGISPWCKKCCVKNAVENKRKRRAMRTSYGKTCLII
ncbi:MAG: HNH endonuclease [Candidatus Cloacimonadota bacterium]|nr:MAG: HNH endonuclease [Candidatus Cloacimonadota bacterium]